MFEPIWSRRGRELREGLLRILKGLLIVTTFVGVSVGIWKTSLKATFPECRAQVTHCLTTVSTGPTSASEARACIVDCCECARRYASEGCSSWCRTLLLQHLRAPAFAMESIPECQLCR